MEIDDKIRESDVSGGAPHPRLALNLFGHERAEQDFHNALESGRLHHAWLLTGPKGIGKATLAWSLARHLLHCHPQQSTEMRVDENLDRRIRALSEPSLRLVRRQWNPQRKRFNKHITVGEIRELGVFLATCRDGYGVAIIDSADDMSVSAANAILKNLEEPPPHTIFLMVSHAPSMLLATIRSRSVELKCQPLGLSEMKKVLGAHDLVDEAGMTGLAELAGGSPGEAWRIASRDGIGLYGRLVALFSDAAGFSKEEAGKLAEDCSAPNSEQDYRLMLNLTRVLIARLARTGAACPPLAEIVPGELGTLADLSPNRDAAICWADLYRRLSRRIADSLLVNALPAAVVFEIFRSIDKTAGIARAVGQEGV